MPFARIIIGLLTLASTFFFVNCMAACLNDNWKDSILWVNIFLGTLILFVIRVYQIKGRPIDAFLWGCVVLNTVILLATVAISLFGCVSGM